MRCPRRFLLTSLTALLMVSGCGSGELIEPGEQSPETAAETTPSATKVPETTAAMSSTDESSSTTTTTVRKPPVVDGLPAPAITLGLDDDTALELTDAYEPVVLFFWATWCHNCHLMMPEIDQMAADYEGRATVVAVARLSSDDDIETDVIEYLPSGVTRWVSDDDSVISEAFRIPGNPVSIVVVGGVEVDRWLGSTAVSDIQTRLDEVLALYD